MNENDEFRVIPVHPYYFINRSGEIKKRDPRGRPMAFKRDSDGFTVCALYDGQRRRTVHRVVDLIASAFPEEE